MPIELLTPARYGRLLQLKWLAARGTRAAASRRRLLLPRLKFAIPETLEQAWGAPLASRQPGPAQALDPAVEDVLRVRAEERLAHRIPLYGILYECGDHPDWQADPATGYLFDPSARHSRAAGRADIKKVWKLSCGHHLLELAAAYAVCRQERFAEAVWRDILDWLSENHDESGPNWWSPTEAALRVAVWSLALRLAAGHAPRIPAASQQAVLAGLGKHWRFIRANLEDWPLHTNHYVSNLAGLYLSTAMFSGIGGSEEINRFASGELEREIRSQVGADGVHGELSCHYHRLVAELFLCPYAVSRTLGLSDFSPEYAARLHSMVRVLRQMTNRLGVLPQIGDNDSEVLYCVGLDHTAVKRDIRPFLAMASAVLDGGSGPGAEAPSLLDLTGLVPLSDEPPPPAEAEATGLGWRTFPSAGWHVSRAGELDLVAVCGPVGTGGTGAHDHNHLNQLLVSAGGVEFIVDPGTGCYTADPALRNRLRSVQAHSTVFGGVEPASWKPGTRGLFYLRRLWQATSRQLDASTIELTGRFAGVTHVRRICAGSGIVDVEDTLCQGKPGSYVQWVLHPEVRIAERSGQSCTLCRGDRTLTIRSDSDEWTVEPVLYSEHFGHVGTTKALRAALGRNPHRTVIVCP